MALFKAKERTIKRVPSRVHHAGAIKAILKAVNDHKTGLPEFMKNSAGAYHRLAHLPKRTREDRIIRTREDRVIVLLFRTPHGRRRGSVGCLDLVGMTNEDIDLFQEWYNPNAASRGDPSAELWGGHGNGAKSYMLKMFEQSWFATSRDARYTRMGWHHGSYDIGYIPSRAESGNVRLSAPLDRLNAVLKDSFGASLETLPSRAQQILRKRPYWTCFTGIDAQSLTNPARLLEVLQHNPQAIRAIEYCSVYTVVNGHPAPGGAPLSLASIQPLPGGESPFEVAVPRSLSDPEGAEVDTTDGGLYPIGKLVMRTSSEAMLHSLKHRHVIRCESETKGTIGLYDVEDLAGRDADHVYGELHLESLKDYETNFRQVPNDAPLTRAVKRWLRQQISAYADRFNAQAQDRYTDQERKELLELNRDMNRFLHDFLDEIDTTAGSDGTGESGNLTGRGRVPLPEGEVARIEHNLGEGVSLCGENVSLHVRLDFFDSEGNRVRAVPVHWETSNELVAYAQLGSIITGQAGLCQVCAVAENGVRSSPINLEVVHLDTIDITPESSPMPLGSRRYLQYRAALGECAYPGVKLDWDSTDEGFVKVGSNTGVVTATAGPGRSEVWASALGVESKHIEIYTTVEGGGGKEPRYPTVLLSELENDPDTQVPKRIDPLAGTVVQDVADRKRNIYWVNMRSPIAERFNRPDGSLTTTSSEFRVYLAERYAEVVFRSPLHQGDEWEPGDIEELLRDQPTRFRQALANHFEEWLKGEWRP